MNEKQFEEALTWMETRWGQLHRGWTVNVQAIYSDFAPYPAHDMDLALAAVYNDGGQSCPSPSKVMAVLRDRVAQRPAAIDPDEWADYCADQGHRWGIVEQDEDGTRLGLCGRCKATRKFPPGTLHTAGEIEDGLARAPEAEVY